MTVRTSAGLKTYLADNGFNTAFDTTGRINLYSGSQPATADTAASGTLFGTLTPGSDAFQTSGAGGTMAINTVTGIGAAAAAGTLGYGRFYRNGDTAPGSTGGPSDRRLDFSIGPRTTLTGNHDNSITTVTVADTSSFPTSGTLLIDSEQMTYTGKTGTTFTGVTRAQNSTSAASHLNAATVYQTGFDVYADNLSVSLNGVINLTNLTITEG